MAGIFICYRREDTAGWAGRLCADLKASLRGADVFMDIDAIPPGVRFDEYIAQAVGSCSVLLALIGPRWLTVTDKNGRRRLDDPADFTRLEIVTALRRNIPVIPALVGGARVPAAEDLPADLKLLVRRQSYELADHRWAADCRGLAQALSSMVRPKRRAGRHLLAGLGLLGLVILGGYGVKLWIDYEAGTQRTSTKTPQPTLPTPLPTLPWAPVATAPSTPPSTRPQATSPAIQLSVTKLEFGLGRVGEDTRGKYVQKLRITNLTGRPLALSYTRDGTDPADFPTRRSNCEASLTGAMTVADECYIDIDFVPTAAGRRSAVLIVDATASGEPERYRVTLSGTGHASTPVSRPRIQLSVSELDFGSRPVGSDPRSYRDSRVVVTNTTGTPLAVKYQAAGANPRDFPLLASDCDAALRGLMTVVRDCYISIDFDPSEAGPREAVLSVDTQTVVLRGTGVAENAAAPGAVRVEGASCQALGSGVYRVELWGKVAGPADSVLNVGDRAPGPYRRIANEESELSCGDWTKSPSAGNVCMRAGGPRSAAWRLRKVFAPQGAPVDAYASLYTKTSGKTPIASKQVRLTCS